MEADLVAHGRGALAELGGGEDVAGLVDEGAGEVLGVGDDVAFVEAALHFGLRLLVGLVGDEGEGVDAQVLAVAAVGVDVEVGEHGAFDEGAGGEVAGERVHVLVGEGVVFGEGDGELAEGARLGEADGGAGGLADFVDGEGLGFAEADDEQALGFDAGGGVEQQGFGEGGLELAGGEPGGGGVGDGVRGGEQDGVRLGVFAGGDVDGEDGEERGGGAGGSWKSSLVFTGLW